MQWAPVLFLPAPFQASTWRSIFPQFPENRASALPLADFRLTPHYPARPPLDDLLRKVDPNADEYLTEKYAFEIKPLLAKWSQALESGAPALNVLAKFIAASIEATSLIPTQENKLHSANRIEVLGGRFGNNIERGRDRFLQEMKTYLAQMPQIETAEFQIIGIEEIAATTLPTVRLTIRYDFVGGRADGSREERIGHWLTLWARDASDGWRALKWEATEEILSRVAEPIFIDVTSHALGKTESYQNQMLRGVDHWRTVLDGACGIDVYGNNGLAVGDIDNDGFDDLYVCQPSGLPNRLYRNRGDGTFEDVTELSGVGVLDDTACALFADFENKGVQDLVVVCGSGPLLFMNQGKGKFALKRDAFKFLSPPQGTFTQAAIADFGFQNSPNSVPLCRPQV